MAWKFLADNIDEMLVQFRDAAPGLADAPSDAYAVLNAALARFGKPNASAVNDIVRGWSIAESPIEKRLLPFLILQDYGPRLDGHAVLGPPLKGPGVAVIPQFRTAGARFDFLVWARRDGAECRVVVECDGAAFHDKERDAKRDAAAIKNGYVVVRASGSEIHAAPEKVATRVATIIGDWAGVPTVEEVLRK